jgi:hypothetical protein
MSDKKSASYKSLETAIQEVMAGITKEIAEVNEAKSLPLPASSQKVLKDHQRAIKKLASALRDYYKTLFSAIDDVPDKLDVPDYDETINYDSGANKYSPLAQKASDNSMLIKSKIRDVNTWEKTTSIAIDALLRGRYPERDDL